MSDQRAMSSRPAPPRYTVHVPRRIVRSERCINCGTCVEACYYGCHERLKDDPRKLAEPTSGCCRSCFTCVLRCPRQALSMHRSEGYEAQGDETYGPDLIRATLDQAATGKLPVSGAGYGGPFDGEGYDGMWTDMSEIVRPTRDGIHGRERISTAISLGRKIGDLSGLHFDAEGNLRSPIPPLREVAIPVLFGALPFAPMETVSASVALAATKLTTYATMAPDDVPERVKEYINHLCVRLDPGSVERHRKVLDWATIVEFDPGEDQLGAVARARDLNPHLLTVLRVPVGPDAPARVVALAEGGAETVHLAADLHGRGEAGATLLGCLEQTHRGLVEEGLRDRVTLLASGGVAAAEHVPKTIILGADGVYVDVPLLLALECTLCGECRTDGGQACPRGLEAIDPRWGATRIINLMTAWRDQLLEVLGAMGLRDVRRLRGERGRAIFAKEARADFERWLLAKPVGERKLEPPLGRPPALPEAREAAHRFPVRLGAHRVVVDRERCTDCGVCEASCRLGVHRRPPGKLHLDEPRHDRCLGPRCAEENDWCCLEVCPFEALSLEADSSGQVLGDRRWTSGMLRRTYDLAARSGELAQDDPALRVGASGGGFDVIALPESLPGVTDPGPADLSLALNRRGVGPRVDMPLPFYGGGMSYGSISLSVMVGRAMAAAELGTFTSTGEGGYPEALRPWADHVITQVATGLFGVREETIQRARMIEFKYAQGAKPGLGGHLLGAKNTAEVAAMREAVVGTSLFSPFPFHSVYSVEDHKKHLDWMRAIKPDLLVSVKVSTPEDVDMVAVGAYHAGANVIHLDGAYGGTGAAPDIAKKNIAMPIEYATARVHDFLVAEGIRDEVTLMVSGGVRTPEDLLKAVALGADGCVLGTAELVAIDCVRCRNCERDRGCPIGIATTDRVLAKQLTAPWVRDRIINMYRAWALELDRRLRALGLRSLLELRGRRDLLEVRPAAQGVVR